VIVGSAPMAMVGPLPGNHDKQLIVRGIHRSWKGFSAYYVLKG